VTAKPIVPRELANRDVDEAIAYHLSESSDEVALGFVDALERAYRHISRRPASGSSRYAVELNLPGLCSWPLRRFPYVVCYVETKDCINVWRVLHSARDIPAWMHERWPE
jgi:toxin ParE1/3/4